MKRKLNGFETAVIGVSCRHPGASEIEPLWHSLCRGSQGRSLLLTSLSSSHEPCRSFANFQIALGHDLASMATPVSYQPNLREEGRA